MPHSRACFALGKSPLPMVSPNSTRRLAALLGVLAVLCLFGLAQAHSEGNWRTYLPIAALEPTLTPSSTPTPSPTATPQPSATPSPTPTVTPSAMPPDGAVYPNDSDFSRQWGMSQIRAPEGWSISTGAPIVVAVLDTGVDYTHPDLVGRFVDSSLWWDFANSDPDPMDRHGHGTHVAGIAGAASNNGLGVAGVSWGARLMPLKVLRDDGVGTTSYTAQALNWAIANGAQVVNMSLGSGGNDPVLASAVARARNAGLILVASAGNCHQGGPTCGNQPDRPSYPAAYPGVIAVAATDISNGHASYSTVQPYVDVAAPGGDGSFSIFSTLAGGGYGGLNGTSMAAPHVAGLAALVLGLAPTLTPTQVECVLTSTAADLGDAGRDDTFGHGRVDARYALEKAWYGGQACAQAAEARVQVAPLPVAPTCDTPHVPDHLIVRRNAAQAPLLLGARPLTEWGEWQLLEVPTGLACALMQALNEAAGEVVASLDLIYTLPEA